MRLPLLLNRPFAHLLRRNASFSSSTLPSFGLEKIETRSLLKVSGPEACAFLQGLITNDMRHLEKGATSMFCMFLNTKGRVIFDSIVYTDSSPDTFLLECDKSAQESLKRHLTIYKVRRKISIEAGPVSVYAAFGDSAEEKVDGLLKEKKSLVVCRDPRLKDLGFRLLAEDGDLNQNCSGLYKSLRMSLGVGEGVEEISSGNSFPLEANCDYLHGVSFHKGCYIGQELTARTHHTGVVRKRLMPVFFEPAQNLPAFDTPVLDASGKNVGKLKGITEKGVGLALLRVAEVLKSPDSLKIGELSVVTKRPDWWPPEVSKDKPGAEL